MRRRPLSFPIIYGTHLPVLCELLQQTTGDVLELGTGIFSTPLMHWLCFDQGRFLASYESQRIFYTWAIGYASDLHTISLVSDWDTIPIDRSWSVAMVDHSNRRRRLVELRRLASCARFILLHDSHDEDREPSYEPILSGFKYRFDWALTTPRTTVVSNFEPIPLRERRKP